MQINSQKGATKRETRNELVHRNGVSILYISLADRILPIAATVREADWY
jgi:hypothetical protein